MKFATYRNGESTRIGIVDVGGARVFDLAAAAARGGGDSAPFASMLALIDADDAGLDSARALLADRGGEPDLWTPLDKVALLAPLPEPRQMRDAMSFERHIRQSPRGSRALEARESGGEAAFRAAMEAPLEEMAAIYRQMPIYYITNRFTVAPPEATVSWPRYSQVMDYELEIAIITRRTRANIPAAEAGAHIFGYTIFNDFSARDQQRLEMQGRLGPAKGKSFDNSNAMGPWIVTPDEIGDPQALKVEVRVNGETRATGVTESMLFPFPELLGLCLPRRDHPRGRILRFGDDRQLLRTGDRAFLGRRRCHRAHRREDRDAAQQSRAPKSLKRRKPWSVVLVDISVAMQNDIASDMGPGPKITYIDHEEGIPVLLERFPGLAKKDLPDGKGWAVEQVNLSTHNGTHLDAPWHFSSDHETTASGPGQLMRCRLNGAFSPA